MMTPLFLHPSFEAVSVSCIVCHRRRVTVDDRHLMILLVVCTCRVKLHCLPEWLCSVRYKLLQGLQNTCKLDRFQGKVKGIEMGITCHEFGYRSATGVPDQSHSYNKRSEKQTNSDIYHNENCNYSFISFNNLLIHILFAYNR